MYIRETLCKCISEILAIDLVTLNLVTRNAYGRLSDTNCMTTKLSVVAKEVKVEIGLSYYIILKMFMFTVFIKDSQGQVTNMSIFRPLQWSR